MTEPGLAFRALYRGEVSGRTRDEGVEAFARESWKSGGRGLPLLPLPSVAMDVVIIDDGGKGVMTSSRHCGASEELLVFALGRGTGLPSRPGRVWSGWLFGEGAMDWKAWMGRASKNSWAKMKGVLLGSGKVAVSVWELVKS